MLAVQQRPSAADRFCGRRRCWSAPTVGGGRGWSTLPSGSHQPVTIPFNQRSGDGGLGFTQMLPVFREVVINELQRWGEALTCRSSSVRPSEANP